MSAREHRAELRARKKALRAAMAAQRKALKARLEATPAVQKQARRRRIRRLVLAVVALLLILACCGECGPGAPTAPPPVKPKASIEVPKPPPPSPPKPPRPPLTAPKLDPAHRARYALDESRPPTWLELLRLQVAARSVKLAACFEGVERPGALRWSAALTPSNGAVGDQTFERLGAGDDVTGTQRECLERVLSTPPFRLASAALDAGTPPTTPTRVGFVLDF